MSRLFLLDEATKRALIRAARKYESERDFLDEADCEEWMNQILSDEAEEGEPLTESQVDEINKVLAEIYSLGHGELISLGEWAKKNGIDPATARQRANRGAFETAKKIGNIWVIDENEELIDHRKKDLTTKIYKDIFDYDEDHGDVNSFMKAVVINFGDERGDIIVENDNFGTGRKYADFTEGKKKAGLHPMQIVFSGIELAKIEHTRYVNANDEICEF